MTRTRLAGLALAACAVLITSAIVGRRRYGLHAPTPPPPPPADARAPAGARIRVQVLNGTKTRGLARRATMLLRDRGFDVVEIGTTNENRDTTLVLDLSGHPDWTRRVARALGSARVETRIDSSRYLDITVVLGATWRPPSQPFYP
jgi:hypothetical protein